MIDMEKATIGNDQAVRPYVDLRVETNVWRTDLVRLGWETLPSPFHRVDMSSELLTACVGTRSTMPCRACDSVPRSRISSGRTILCIHRVSTNMWEWNLTGL